jgi:hypothetical protein
MAQPAFTWWPWRSLAAVVGLGSMAIGALLIDGPGTAQSAVPAAVALFASGNALILGAAMGDTGRTVAAMLISLCVASVSCFVPLGRDLSSLYLIVPAVTGATTGSLSMDRSVRGFISSVTMGLVAALIGAATGGLAWLFLMTPTVLFLRNAGDIVVGGVVIAVTFVAVAVGNVFLIGYLFRAAHRVRSETETRRPDGNDPGEEQGA